MQQLNNMDIAILVIVGISALIALGRGLVKEVLSIVGWVLCRSCRHLPAADFESLHA